MPGKKKLLIEKAEGVHSKKRARLLCDLDVPKIPQKVGTICVCGTGDVGQLGLGEDQTERKRPTLNEDVQDAVDVCAGGMHSLVLTKNGEVYSFGCNDEGALGRETNDDDIEFVPMKVNLPGKCVKISAGDSHSAFLLEDGEVYACGSFRDSHGNMGLTLEGNKRVPMELLNGIKSCDIASGADHLMILTCNGKVYTIGCGEQGQLGRVALRSASGDSRRGKTDLLTPAFVSIQRGKLSQKIWATNYCSFAKEFNGNKIHAFGLNNYNQLGFKSKKEVEVRPTDSGLENVKTIAGGQQHTLILTENKKCYAIGKKDYGRLGLGNIENDIEEFKEIKFLSDKNIIDISCGDSQSFAITNDGKLYAWGMGSNNQLGTGNDDDELEPVLVTSKSTLGKNFIKVSSGGQHTLFLLEDNNNENKTTQQISQPNGGNVTLAKDNNKLLNNIEKPTSDNKNVSDKENNDNDIKKQTIQKKQTKNDKNLNNGIEQKVTNNEKQIIKTVPENTVTEIPTTNNKRGRKKK